MKLSLLPAIALPALLALRAGAGAVEPAAASAFRLPQDPAMPVVVLEFDQAPSGEAPQPEWSLAICSDGKATVTVDSRRRFTDRIPPQELQQLLQELFVENELLDCRTSDLEQSIRTARRARRRPAPGRDAATTVIRVQGADASHEIRCHALGLTANQLPDLPAVRRLFQCQRRLENVAAVVRAGGYDHVNEVLSAANRQLRLQAPTADLLTSRELSLVDLRPDGTRYLQFSRAAGVDGLEPPGGFVSVSVYQIPGRPPEITVTADAS